MFLHVPRGERRASGQTRNMGQVNSVAPLLHNRTFNHSSLPSHMSLLPLSPHPLVPSSPLLPSPLLMWLSPCLLSSHRLSNMESIGGTTRIVLDFCFELFLTICLRHCESGIQ